MNLSGSPLRVQVATTPTVGTELKRVLLLHPSGPLKSIRCQRDHLGSKQHSKWKHKAENVGAACDGHTGRPQPS